jgi:hypothetical protein
LYRPDLEKVQVEDPALRKAQRDSRSFASGLPAAISSNVFQDPTYDLLIGSVGIVGMIHQFMKITQSV